MEGVSTDLPNQSQYFLFERRRQRAEKNVRSPCVREHVGPVRQRVRMGELALELCKLTNEVPKGAENNGEVVGVGVSSMMSFEG